MKTTSNTNLKNLANNEMSMSSGNGIINKTQINYDSSYMTNQTKNIKRKKVFSQKNINNYDSVRTTDIHTQQRLIKNSMTNLNSKLSPNNYVKPLYYLLYNQIKPINKQFLGYRDERTFIYYQYPDNKNDIIQYKTKTK